jgi:hypothetical protein
LLYDCHPSSSLRFSGKDAHWSTVLAAQQQLSLYISSYSLLLPPLRTALTGINSPPSCLQRAQNAQSSQVCCGACIGCQLIHAWESHTDGWEELWQL